MGVKRYFFAKCTPCLMTNRMTGLLTRHASFYVPQNSERKRTATAHFFFILKLIIRYHKVEVTRRRFMSLTSHFHFDDQNRVQSPYLYTNLFAYIAVIGTYLSHQILIDLRIENMFSYSYFDHHQLPIHSELRRLPVSNRHRWVVSLF